MLALSSAGKLVLPLGLALIVIGSEWPSMTSVVHPLLSVMEPSLFPSSHLTLVLMVSSIYLFTVHVSH